MQTLFSEVPFCLERPVQASDDLVGQSIHVHGHVSPHERETIDGFLAQVSNKIDGRLEVKTVSHSLTTSIMLAFWTVRHYYPE
jgi:hypothetical protein